MLKIFKKAVSDRVKTSSLELAIYRLVLQSLNETDHTLESLHEALVGGYEETNLILGGVSIATPAFLS